MYFIDPVQLQGLKRGLLGSSSDRHILQIYESLEDICDYCLKSLEFLSLISYSFSFETESSKSKTRLSNPAIVSPLFKLLKSIGSVA
jgi:hypothetical protein